MLKIIHTADWHLRDMQFGKTSRAKDFADSVFRIVDIAKREGAQYILCAGDILNSKRPSSQNIGTLMALNHKLLDAKISLLVITGNHDKCVPSWTKLLQQEMEANGDCAIFDLDYEMYRMEGDAGDTYTVYGVPDLAPDVFRDQSKTWPTADILMYHGLIRDFASFDSGDKTLSVDELPHDRYKAILLGDIHTHKYVNKNGCTIGYPGSTELCSRSESVDKYVTLFTFAPNGTHMHESVPLPLSKPIIARDIRTNEEANSLLKDVEAIAKQHPTLLIRKDPKFTDLYIRLARIVDTKECIIRVTNLPQAGFKLMNLANRRTGGDPNDKKPTDFLAEYFSTTTDTFALAQALCEPDAKASQLLESFIDNRLYANKKTIDKKFGQA